MENTNPPVKHKRKIIFIKKKQQLTLIAFVLIAVLFGMSFVFYCFVDLIASIFKNHPVLLQIFFEEGYGLLVGFAIKILICFAVLALITAMLSNRLSGPIYRMETLFKQVAGGDYAARAHLRDGDAYQDMAKEFNNMMDALEPKLRQPAAKPAAGKEEGKND